MNYLKIFIVKIESHAVEIRGYNRQLRDGHILIKSIVYRAS